MDLQRFTAMTAVCQRLRGCRSPSHHSTLELPLNISTVYLRLTQWHAAPICNSGSRKISAQEEAESYIRDHGIVGSDLCLSKKKKMFFQTQIIIILCLKNFSLIQFIFHVLIVSVSKIVCLKEKKTLFLKGETRSRSRSSYLGMLVNYLRGSK